MPFDVKQLAIPEVSLIMPKMIVDERGYFMEIFKISDLWKAGIRASFVQANQSKSVKNVLRGLHYQMGPMPQGKLVRVLSGEIFDAAVDIRKGSPTYGKWVGERLSCENKSMMYIPAGFAHGFCVLSDNARIEYYCTAEYEHKLDRGIRWNDPAIGIEWPVGSPLLSPKDAGLPLLKDADNNFEY